MSVLGNSFANRRASALGVFQKAKDKLVKLNEDIEARTGKILEEKSRLEQEMYENDKIQNANQDNIERINSVLGVK